MLKIQPCPDITFRIAHDISLDSFPDDDPDVEFDLSPKELEFYSLTQSKENKYDVAEKDHEKSEYEDITKKIGNLTQKLQKLDYESSDTEIVLRKNEINKQLHSNIDNGNGTPRLDKNCFTQLSSVKAVNCVNNKEWPTNNQSIGNELKPPRRPRKLPETPKTKSKYVPANPPREKSLAEELIEATSRQKSPMLQDAETDDNDDEVFLSPSQTASKLNNESREHLFDRLLYFNVSAKNAKAYIHCDNPYIIEDSFPADKSGSRPSSGATVKNCRTTSDSEESRRKSSSSSSVCANYQELEVTHRGMHRFIPRHSDELAIEIGDPIHVKIEDDDLWCEGVNLRTGHKGIFPSMYATDLQFLEEEDDDNVKKFQVKFLGSLEVNCHKGTEVICQAINKIALTRRSTLSSTPPPSCCLEVSDYGIRMIDKSKTVHESDAHFSNFFALKNISYCGYHPRNESYFAFITKHPREYRFACHVFLGDHSTRSISEALGHAFKRFYREYMAFTHPTEDIYLE